MGLQINAMKPEKVFQIPFFRSFTDSDLQPFFDHDDDQYVPSEPEKGLLDEILNYR